MLLSERLTPQELSFMSQSDIFLELFLKEKGFSSLSDVEPITSRSPFPVPPVLVQDFRELQEPERAQILEDYHRWGVAHIILLNPDDPPQGTHPMLDICEQLKEALHLYYPLRHPAEGHPEAVTRFGAPDGTAKIYDLPKPINGTSYREVAETSEALEAHADGIGSGGTVQTIALYLDSAPLFGGFTFFYDVLSLGIELAKTDMEAFRALFLPDALTAIRPRGKGAIKVVSPAFYLNEQGQPQVFFRSPTGEYQAIWRDYEPLQRASQFFSAYTKAFSNGSYFVPFGRRGQMSLSRNRDLAHGRTSFVDGTLPHQRRLLSRKWFATSEKHGFHKSVPGVAIHADYATLFPEQFGEDKLTGKWLYDAQNDTNQPVKS